MTPRGRRTSVTQENNVTDLTTVIGDTDITNTSSVTTILTSFEREEQGQLTVLILTLNLNRKMKKYDYPYFEFLHARLITNMKSIEIPLVITTC